MWPFGRVNNFKEFLKMFTNQCPETIFTKCLRKIHSNPKWSHGGGALDSYPTFKIQLVGIQIEYRSTIWDLSDQRPLRTLLIKCLKLTLVLDLGCFLSLVGLIVSPTMLRFCFKLSTDSRKLEKLKNWALCQTPNLRYYLFVRQHIILKCVVQPPT